MISIIMVGVLIMLLIDNVIFYQFKKVVNQFVSFIEQLQDEVEELKSRIEVEQ